MCFRCLRCHGLQSSWYASAVGNVVIHRGILRFKITKYCLWHFSSAAEATEMLMVKRWPCWNQLAFNRARMFPISLHLYWIYSKLLAVLILNCQRSATELQLFPHLDLHCSGTIWEGNVSNGTSFYITFIQKKFNHNFGFKLQNFWRSRLLLSFNSLKVAQVS